MKNYRKKTTGEVYGFELDGSQDYLITDEFETMKDYEMDVHKGGHSEAIKNASLGIVDKIIGFFN